MDYPISYSPSPIDTDIVSFCFQGPALPDDCPVFVDGVTPSRSLNISQFQHLVCTLIAGLRAQKVQRGQCVLVHLDNSILSPALFLAIVGAGGVYMGANPASSVDELKHLLALAEPRLIVTRRDTLSTVLASATVRGLKPEQVCVLDDIDHIIDRVFEGSQWQTTHERLKPVQDASSPLNFTNLVRCGQRSWISFADAERAKTTTAAMFLTSGTSGLPKAAILTHQALILQHMSVYCPVPYPVTRLLAMPLFHRYGALWAHFFPVRYAQPLVLLPQFQLAPFLDAVRRHCVTETHLSPWMVHVLIQSSSSMPIRESLQSLRYVCVGGAPIDKRPLQLLQDMLHPDACVAQEWGMTETGTVIHDHYCKPYEQYDKESIGCVVPGYEARLVSLDSGDVIQSDETIGELHVRGPGLFLGYKGCSDSPKDSDGWLPTGDVLYVKKEHYFLVGRVKELIKVRGYQVAPVELETQLISHSLIKDVAVIGITASDRSTELPRAYVVPISWAQRPSAEDIYGFLRRRTASYKALDGGIVFVDWIPRTSSGKIRRQRLLELDAQRENLVRLLS
ncbi:hypothetical protein EYZ11_009171 [Aspergillus tanneri]|uniref:AMP-dependent synthetase/ligase domain-containing protein n=1 Tax=Aspergillus tanneri TaxID=1220188 RepID=A0A4S3J8Z9_9EURO|nr:uncharacterized protein ATNIH1004_004554 [Aspergillus tanneri]KAA8648669.1 hypothetical protein ATNIH1004_004554 [Aspergillus tanneri]THC91372.1 hypothetical protein EYZ11_009171 [Aspergillus tanneri]